MKQTDKQTDTCSYAVFSGWRLELMRRGRQEDEGDSE